MPSIVLSTLHVRSQTSKQSEMVGTVITLISQIVELQHRKVRSFAQVYTTSVCQSQGLSPNPLKLIAFWSMKCLFFNISAVGPSSITTLPGVTLLSPKSLNSLYLDPQLSPSQSPTIPSHKLLLEPPFFFKKAKFHCNIVDWQCCVFLKLISDSHCSVEKFPMAPKGRKI